MELSSIAKPYAQAIFEVAEQSNSISKWSSFLATASAVMSDESTKAFIAVSYTHLTLPTICSV